MTESIEHKTCKNNLADLLGGRTEVSFPNGKRVDVIDQRGNEYEVECKRDSHGKMNCVIVTPKNNEVDCGCINNLAIKKNR